jgi:hypothetical protein
MRNKIGVLSSASQSTGSRQNILAKLKVQDRSAITAAIRRGIIHIS